MSSFYPRSFDLSPCPRLPPLISLFLLYVSQYRSMTAIGQKKASSPSLVFTRDKRNKDREKRSGKIPCSIMEPVLQNADPGCLSRIRDLGSRIKNLNKREGWKKISCHTLFCSHKFQKIENYLFLKCWKKIVGPVFKELLNLTQKFVTKL